MTPRILKTSFSFMGPVSSSMIAPATGQVASTFGIDNDVINALTTSIFVLAFAFGPLFVGPMSELYGRSRVLQVANLWYLAWNFGCGFAQTESQLLVFRFLAGMGGGAPTSVRSAAVFLVIAGDQKREEKPSRFTPWLRCWGLPVGPITGAWIAERSSWRWVFWSTSIADAVIQILGVFCLRETYAPILLERKAERIRRSMDAEKVPYGEIRTVFDRPRSLETGIPSWPKHSFALSHSFSANQSSRYSAVYMAYLYGSLYIILTTIPSIFQGVYQQSVGIAGLHYIALGIGLVGASCSNASILDKVYLYLKSKKGGVGKPEFRLPPMFPGTLLFMIGCLILGWAAQAQAHWIVPDIGIVLAGAGITLNIQSVHTYIVDCFTLHAASALAAACCLRALAGFGFPLFAPAMYSALGFGKGDTILAVAAFVLGCPAPWILWRYGERIRNSSRYAHP
ncbi:major facilitator superfamily domain-containing protein [Suillus paluster]|uniref:major facilitator superfamily domain-containing protein n=1 Tax=Suillus paluster TaxID=48578 RepID=UPI001B86BF3B|nr:major facilitator superfamily domain-containing protein [Suillus paluster]KAG1731364.1 major facilitator superfamily domain-containing protein [Suillus paluster]